MRRLFDIVGWLSETMAVALLATGMFSAVSANIAFADTFSGSFGILCPLDPNTDTCKGPCPPGEYCKDTAMPLVCRCQS